MLSFTSFLFSYSPPILLLYCLLLLNFSPFFSSSSSSFPLNFFSHFSLPLLIFPSYIFLLFSSSLSLLLCVGKDQPLGPPVCKPSSKQLNRAVVQYMYTIFMSCSASVYTLQNKVQYTDTLECTLQNT